MKIDINTSTLNGYVIHETDCGYKICKILNEYDKDQLSKVNADLVELLTHKKTEYDLLREYRKKKIF